MVAKLKDIRTANLENKRVIVRVDFNVPFFENRVTDTTRIQRSVKTIRVIKGLEGRPVLISHFGRPSGKIVPEFSLSQIVPAVEEVLGEKVRFFEDIYSSQTNSDFKGISLLENLRFYPGEVSNCYTFSQRLSHWGEIFCNDAFSVSHRSHASVVGITKFLPSFAGLNLINEITHINSTLSGMSQGTIAIIGGAKISTKISVLKNLLKRVDFILIGGAMGNTFLKAKGFRVGSSLLEADQILTAKAILALAEKENCQIVLPSDVVVSETLTDGVSAKNKSISELKDSDSIFDIGKQTIKDFCQIIGQGSTVLWNGPVGAFEYDPFQKGTVEIGKFVAEKTQSKAIQSIIGGGDTISALSGLKILEQFGFVSTAGGAFIAFLEGKSLRGVKAVEIR